MLKKLIKYDLQWMFKIILIFYSLGIVFASFGRLMEYFPDSMFFNFLSSFSKIISVSLVVSGIFNCVIRSWVRLINNVYKDESYLTHTLPIKRETHLLSKIISTLIVVFVSILVLLITLLIVYLNKDNIEFLKQSLNIVTENLGLSISIFLVVLLLVVFMEIMYIVIVGYFGIVYGYSFNDKKFIYSLIYGFVTYLICNIVIFMFLIIGSLFIDGLYDIVFGGSTIDFNILKSVFIITAVVYTCFNVLLSYLCIKKIRGGVNID